MPELSKRLQKSLDRIKRAGGVIMIHHGAAASMYQFPDGRIVAPAVAAKLLDAGLLESGHDGLFEDDQQTLHVVAS